MNAADWRFARVEHLVQTQRTTTAGLVLTSVLMAALVWDRAAPPVIGAWLLATWAIIAARAWQVRAWFRGARDSTAYTKGHRWFMLGTSASALSWSTCWWFVPALADSPRIVPMLLCAVTSVMILSFGGFATVSRLFLLLTTLPMLAVWVFAPGVLPADVLLGSALYLGVMWRLGALVERSFDTHARQRAEHAELVAELRAAKAEAEALNDELNAKIAHHRATELALLTAKDEAEQAAQAKTEFLANMSHEIRTPMNGVMGMTELLLATELSKKQRHFAEMVHRSGENLLGIINDILDFSKIEAGKLEIHSVPFDLRTLIEDIGLMFAERAERAGVSLVCKFAADAHAAYRGDPDRLQQVLTNLVGNALKFTTHGHVLVRAEVADEDSTRTLMRFEVEDSGIGIAPEHQARIFDSFTQADGSTTRKFGGTGLGLAICKQITALMGGTIGVRSAPGRGSTFWFTCPLHKERARETPLAHRLRLALDGRRVLIGDENAAQRELLGLQLTAWRMHQQAVATPKEALRVLERAAADGRPFECMILDHGFGGDGLQFAASLRRFRRIPLPRFVMLTSVTALQETGQWLDAGIAAYVDKPVRQHDLQRALARLFDASPLEATAREKPADENAETHFDTHILVAEDNLVNQELVRGLLESMGCRVHVVTNGREALDAVAASNPDAQRDPYQLVLMDCQMPEMDGFDATRAIRDHEARTGSKRLPIVALTANALAGDRERCRAADMDDYLAKPFPRRKLVEILQRWLPLAATVVKPAPPPVVESPPATSGRPSIDPEALRKIRSLQRPGAPDLLGKVVALYLEGAPHLLQDMADACANGDGGRLERAAHSLKSSSANLGAMSCSALCRELEQLGHRGELGPARARLDVLQFELENACAALQAEVAHHVAA